MANRNKGDIKSAQIYRRYIAHLTPKEIKEGYHLTQGELNDAVHEVNRRIMESVIKKNFHFIMPYNIGKIMIVMRKFNPVVKLNTGLINRPVDWKETNILWSERPELRGKKFMYHTNSNTGGFIAMFKWLKRTGYLRNGISYGFEPVKDAKRMVARELKDPLSKVDYYELKESLCLPQNI